MCQEPKELNLIRCLTELPWIQEFKSNCCHQEPTGRHVSFARDEWNHLINLLNIINLPMSKRGQEGTSRESSAMAKPRSMNLVMAKPRSITLVPYNMSSKKKDSPRDMSDSDNLENAKVEPGSNQTRIWKQMANTSPYATEHS